MDKNIKKKKLAIKKVVFTLKSYKEMYGKTEY